MMNILANVKPGNRVIVGVGSALVDILAHESDDFVLDCGAIKGGMKLVENAVIDQILEKVSAPPRIVPGGSACNTAVGIGRLGGKSRFVGKCGSGVMGNFYESDLRKQHVEPKLLRSSSPTGRVMSIITPDAQRSMLTYLGASAEAQPGEFTEQYFEGAAIVHIEGYLLFNPDLIPAVIQRARAIGAAISLDLASFNIVAESREFLKKLVRESVDILIANEEEAEAYTGHKDEGAALKALQADAPLAVLKVGPRGSFISTDGGVVSIAARGGRQARDTTGAGDLWAAGFLFGLVQGYSLEKSGELASACGYEVCQVIGTDIPDDGWERIRRLLP
jgi:sugar/nucleoside kinase (ribokinase family)